MGSGDSLLIHVESAVKHGFVTNTCPCYPSRMAQGKTATVRKNITLSAATVGYLEVLARAGTHGSDVVAVIRTMVEEGVRNAIRDRFIETRS